ncbi:MAG: hypothetical protein HYX63_20430 [Gammaproteobacteria bacterium]|nr:hypothetical protein [Gammaproteobacteria bacterium]
MPRYDLWEKLDFRKLQALEDSSLFKAHLMPDIKEGVVFPAIRGGKIDFYHVGRKLFSYTNQGFQSNIAFVVACQNRPKGEVVERDLGKLTLCTSFVAGYEQIRYNTTLYAEPESAQVSHIWNTHSYCRSDSGAIVVLDIELSLDAKDDGRPGSDRIDLVLFDTISKQLHFFEVKTFNNREIRETNGTVPVVEQIERYNRQVKVKQHELVAMYEQYVRIVNRLFNSELPLPLGVSNQVNLLICDYDGPQEIVLKNKILSRLPAEITCRKIGKAKGEVDPILWALKLPK